MCILFLFAAKNQSSSTVSNPSLKLLIASNRDEFYNRPTKLAQFWESDHNILAGQDIEEGGTWLGITKTGKLAALLNIMSKTPEKKMQSRGGFVTGFLRSSPSLRGWTYCNNLHQDPAMDIRNNFRLFNFIAIDLLNCSDSKTQDSQTIKPGAKPKNEPTVSSSTEGPKSSSGDMNITYITNATKNGPQSLFEHDSLIHAFGNSVYDTPFCKVSEGHCGFEKVIKSFQDTHLTKSLKIKLKEDVLEFLKSQERHFPDPQMQSQSKDTNVPPQLLPELSSIFVKSSKMNYGTRTHTVIIIDSENHVDFHEWTLQEPIDIENPSWIESKYEFDISV